MSTPAALELRDIVVRFHNGQALQPALQGLSLDVRSGEFVSLIGPSGCGKSTALNLFAGFVRPDEGDVLLDAKRITGPGPDRAMVFQQYSLFPWLTVRRNVEYGLRALGVARRTREARSLELLRHAGLEDVSDRYPDQLSGGMKQRVGILRAIATDPRVLLMDEPFGALDAQTRTTMQQLLMQTWEEHRITVLFVTHDIVEAVLLSDRVYVMSAAPGRIIDTLEIGLPRPRHAEVVETAPFRDHVRRIDALVRQEGWSGRRQALDSRALDLETR